MESASPKYQSVGTKAEGPPLAVLKNSAESYTQTLIGIKLAFIPNSTCMVLCEVSAQPVFGYTIKVAV